VRIFGIISIFCIVSIISGCSDDRDLGTVVSYIARHGPPDLIASSIEITNKQKGLRVAIVKGAMNKITNASDISVPVFFLTADSSELRWAINHYYLEKAQSTNSVRGMYYPTRSLFGEEITIVKVDAFGTIQSIKSKKIDAVSIRDPVFP
jgi:hypothetical protein